MSVELCELSHLVEDSHGTALIDICKFPDACETTVCSADGLEPLEPKVCHGKISAIGPVYAYGHLAGTAVNNGTSPVEVV